MIIIPECRIRGQKEPVFEVRLLFNIEDDPGETKELSAEAPDVVDDFMEFFERHKKMEDSVRFTKQNRLKYDKNTIKQIRALGYVE